MFAGAGAETGVAAVSTGGEAVLSRPGTPRVGGAGGATRACGGATGRSGGATRGATKSPAKGISSTVSSKSSLASGSIAAEEAPPIMRGLGIGVVMRPCAAIAARPPRTKGPTVSAIAGAITCAGTVPPNEVQSFPSMFPMAAPLLERFWIRLAILSVTLAKELIRPCSSAVKSSSIKPLFFVSYFCPSSA